jgi:hypothetical protein
MFKLIMLSTILILASGCSKACRCEGPASSQDVLAASALVGTEGMSFHEIVDHTREFVNKNSQHPQDASPFGLDTEELAYAMSAYVSGESAEPPILHCGQRARLHMLILSRAGVTSRLVNLVTDGAAADALQGHVFLEALNPASGLWEATDADFNLFYSDGNKRLSLRDLIAKPVNSYEPCRGSACGWQNLPPSAGWFTVMFMYERDFYVAGLVHPGFNNIPASSDVAHIISNSTRFDVNAPRVSLGGKSVLQFYSLDVGGTWEEVSQ